jgi:hypothetical protein
MTYSGGIERLMALLVNAGVTVEMRVRWLADDVAGRYDAKRNHIAVWDTPGAQEALVVLAHEAGHWLDYRMRPYPQTQPGHPRPRREHAAIVLGWKLLGIIEAHKLVTWARWADHHRPVRRPEAAAA